MQEQGPATRVWRPDHALDLRLLLVHRHGAQDSSYGLEGGPDVQAARHWRGVRTPIGPGTMAISRASGGVLAEAWGPGRDWLLDQVPDLLGESDRPEEFRPSDPLIRDLLARHGSPRYGRSGRVIEALVPTIFEQKVTGQEAFAGYANLLRRFGDVAPGPRDDLRILPSPDSLRSIPSWDWIKLPIDSGRSRPLLRAMAVADALERAEQLSAEVLGQRLRSLPGIGEWTEAEVRQRTHGDPDAVSFGDYHVAANVGWALTNAPWTDDQMREYLEPFTGHRRRVVDLITSSAGARPRRGPRMSPRTHLPK
ncbi:3-methyladenine DNA glycosylase [Nocardioides baekrokdamisoli]|uniref:3-methyladenine DNA glycosylase n=1 Tax=Nocardioides baekrokdamisoli TaxID=1804624 RepID=A0A3G9IZ56_9ACTN|nr:DNA-3-methyladenine glycosylase 2 family protein [Nocardioides baekrokdamisoli]BBH15989.1 3-methyladenine DNA glycosylase [Nocardioides baekrokdamisoli]